MGSRIVKLSLMLTVSVSDTFNEKTPNVNVIIGGVKPAGKFIAGKDIAQTIDIIRINDFLICQLNFSVHGPP